MSLWARMVLGVKHQGGNRASARIRLYTTYFFVLLFILATQSKT